MNKPTAEELQKDLAHLFADEYELDVSVGLARDAADPNEWAVMVTSRERDVVMGMGGMVFAQQDSA